MSWEIIAGIIMGLVAFVATVSFQIMVRQRRLELTREKTEVTMDLLSEVVSRVMRLENGIALEAVPAERLDELTNRLAKLEAMTLPLRDRDPKVTSIEYQFIVSEMNRLVRDLKEDLTRQQREQEATLEHRFSVLRTVFTAFLTIIGLILTISLPILFYLVSRAG